MKILLSITIIYCALLSHLTAKEVPSKKSYTAGPTSLQWGFYQILWRHGNYEKELQATKNLLGGNPRYVLFFRDLNAKRGFPAQVVSICANNNLTPVISYEPAPWGHTETYPGLEEIVSGNWDAYFKTYAKEAALSKIPVIFRFGFEVNGNWFSWGHKPELFKKAWIRIHTIFKEQKASNVKWMYCPNVEWGRDTVLNSIGAYYPGGDYVDIVALDGYNFGDNYDQDHKWKSYKELFEESVHKAASFGKPVMIGEIGCAPDSARKPLWIKTFLNSIDNDKTLRGFIYYNYYPQRKRLPNWRLDSDSLTLNIFKNWARTH